MHAPSDRSLSVSHFLVMEILERAHALEELGQDIVHMEVGEPDFPTPQRAVDAAIDAVARGRTHYTHSLGIQHLRDEIARHIEKDHGVEVDAAHVVVTIGSSAALQLAFAAVLEPGDEILVSDPGYPCYPNIARTLGATPRAVPVGPASGFAYDPDDVRRAIGPRTKAIVVNSPANPTGAITPPDVLEALAECPLAVVSDEVYQGLVYEGSAVSMLSVSTDAFVAGGFSKRYAMTGWRLGYLVCPPEYLRAVQAMQQNLFISASDFGQYAAVAALGAVEDVERMRLEFDERRRFLLEALPRIGLRVPVRPRGAFYVFADASDLTSDSMAFAVELLEHAKVAVAPGIDFGSRGEGYLRFSYATSLDRLREGVDRLERHLSSR